MRAVRTLSFAAVLATGFASSAIGADMLFPPAGIEGARPGIVELGTGWYLRGDVGYVDYLKPKDGRESIINEAFDKTRLEETWSAGGGFGYKFLNWFRADVTADHRFGSQFEGTSSRTGYVSDSRRDWGKLDSTTVLANAYIDLGTWYGVTPYLGAGVGVAVNQLQDYRTRVTCLTLSCGALGDQGLVQVRSRQTTDLAWALMGGVAVDVGGGFQVDAGYRYVNLGEANIRFTGSDNATRSKDIEAHEVRLGLRYMIDN
jgi:opacity protein-like surface antigen